jgi:lipopolysaccharide transport system permease protein/teichoic acid transport system permease protein
MRWQFHRFTDFLRKLYQYRAVIWAMAKHELAARYIGTFGGVFWAILHPALTVAIYWFVFAVGFKAEGPGGMPFVLYFVSGLVPWLFFSEVLIASMNAVTANSALVKKTVFPSEILPLVYFVSNSFAHVALILILCVLAWFYGYGTNLTVLKVVYYYGALGCLLLGLSWLAGSVQVFHRDLGQAMGAALSLWFWLTPVVWSSEMIPHQFNVILRLNPIYYVVEGYRSVLTGVPLLRSWWEAFYFWAVAASLLVVGAYVFRRLKPEFADML